MSPARNQPKKRPRSKPKPPGVEGLKQTYDRIRKPVPPPGKVVERDRRKELDDLRRREAEEELSSRDLSV